ncbi:MAG: bleomycin resistance protein [Gordonia sp. (in: high G+C Gram-positive bacteria)]|uniref:bleomycin resistance protein n=1 Tax=Gordonia sp. (in: high G+C Gram-positive bacteria) TaxID=84139 RepID=UPI0039E4B188
MADFATPNLPARDFDASEEFYRRLGFATVYKAGGWMILRRGGLTLEFFGFPDLDPSTSSFSCCLRLDDLDDFYRVAAAAGIPEARRGFPRLHPPTVEASGMRIGYLVDHDGTLVRLVQN